MRAVVVAVILGCLGGPAFADNKAEAHYKQGRAFEKAKAYDDAVGEFQKAYELDKNPSHLFNIGVVYEAKGDLKLALEFYQRYLTDEPKGRFADQARDNITKGTQKLVDQEAKRKADEARIAAEQQKLKDEQDAATKKAKDEQDGAARKAAVVAHLKQAAAYAQAGAWAKAGEEHRAAAIVDGDPQHLIDAADAFHKQPDDVHAREALLAYLDKVPTGETSDKVRVRVAELTKAIEKADAARAAADQAERQRLATLQLGTIGPPPPKRHTTFGFELRGGLGSTASFVTDMPFMEVKSQLTPSFGVGAFADLPVLAAWHVYLGARAQFFKSTYEDTCGSATVRCPTEVSARYIGPALDIRQPIVHLDKFDLFGIGGIYVGLPLGKGNGSFFQEPDHPVAVGLQLEPEFGLGGRYGPVSIHFLFQISITKFNNADLGTDRLDVGNARGFVAVASWAFPRD